MKTRLQERYEKIVVSDVMKKKWFEESTPGA